MQNISSAEALNIAKDIIATDGTEKEKSKQLIQYIKNNTDQQNTVILNAILDDVAIYQFITTHFEFLYYETRLFYNKHLEDDEHFATLFIRALLLKSPFLQSKDVPLEKRNACRDKIFNSYSDVLQRVLAKIDYQFDMLTDNQLLQAFTKAEHDMLFEEEQEREDYLDKISSALRR